MTFDFSIPTPDGPKAISIEPGTAVYFAGANGGGKTRLAVEIENGLGDRCHRISAHRALNLNPEVHKVSEKAALSGLRYGYVGDGSHIGNRMGSRWNSKAATSLLNDYDFLIQTLFAEQANTALVSHKNARAENGIPASLTYFERLAEIWERLLPHRKLHITGDNVKVSVTGTTDQYPASEMSDGERAVFYLIGQTLVAARDSLMIFDEPELHVHRAILSGLWDELEAARPDCAIAIISHDLEFIASRKGKKFVLRAYRPGSGWTIEDVPEETGFSEEVTTLILGSRRPVLFVEGGNTSLDKAVFRACYPGWTVIPRGSCEEVLHAVVTMRANASLTRITCAGVVDADAYTHKEQAALSAKGIETLPVSEIENLFLLPDVVNAIARSEGFDATEVQEREQQLYETLFTHAAEPKNQLDIVLRYCRRRIDRALKKVDLSEAQSVAELATVYAEKTGGLDVNTLAELAGHAIRNAIANRDVPNLLRWYDNKAILSFAAKLKGVTKDKFDQWIVRVLRNETVPELTASLRRNLPVPNAE
ncbi:Protein of unknown function [Burkholderia sp. OK233]|nr:Protein of unknown function [Burkholderia sp. OK233]